MTATRRESTGGLRLSRRAWLVAAGALAGVAVRRGYGALLDPDARQSEQPEPLRLHPENAHYFLFRGRPAVLITSGEHYGAVLNLDFNYAAYLDELAEHGFNQTRTFAGPYCEVPGDFGIEGNTLAPAEGRFICPWARSDQPGHRRDAGATGGSKFDLQRWDDAYFERLHDFVARAGERGIVVELVLFCPFYRDEMWNASPMNARNNVNGLGGMPREQVYTADSELLPVHEALARKLAEELRDYDNLYYEICNEPYFGGVTPAWQERIAAAIAETEGSFDHRHLIAQNIANGSARVEDPNPLVSILNFHYANPPDAVAENYDLDRAIAFDETGFRGSDDLPYRTDAWEFLIAGGAVYSNLDYSFRVGREDGSGRVNAPGGGGESLRRQLAVLKRFIESFDFVRMRPDNEVIRGGVPEGAVARALVAPGRQYAIYIRGGNRASLVLDLPEGSYAAEWLDTRDGESLASSSFEHGGDERTLESPEYTEDIALAVRAE